MALAPLQCECALVLSRAVRKNRVVLLTIVALAMIGIALLILLARTT